MSVLLMEIYIYIQRKSTLIHLPCAASKSSADENIPSVFSGLSRGNRRAQISRNFRSPSNSDSIVIASCNGRSHRSRIPRCHTSSCIAADNLRAFEMSFFARETSNAREMLYHRDDVV